MKQFSASLQVILNCWFDPVSKLTNPQLRLRVSQSLIAIVLFVMYNIFNV